MAFQAFLKSKIHRATITEACLEYEGSISICPELMEKANLLPFEQVDVYNIDNGERLTTYVIKGRSGDICLNGAAARKGEKGHAIIIASYVYLEQSEIDQHTPSLVFVDKKNKAIRN